MATWILAVSFFFVLMVIGVGVFHKKRRNKQNEKVLQGRDYNSWVSNMNIKNGETNHNNYEIK